MAWRGVNKIYTLLEAFAPVLRDGTVVTKEDKYSGGYCNQVKAALRGVGNLGGVCSREEWTVGPWVISTTVAIIIR